MATDKHSPKRARVRKLQGRQNSRTPAPRQGVSTRRRIPRHKWASGRALASQPSKEELEDRIRALSNVMSAIVVSVAALRRQNCDLDEDIACVLVRSAADPLDIEIERLSALDRVGKSKSRSKVRTGVAPW